MAVYQKLNLGAEGGIIDVRDQAIQANCAVLCIGLGGTGCDCLRNLKAKVYNRLRPDNATDDNSSPAIPEYAHIKYLAIDTDEEAFKRDNSSCADFSKLNTQEFFDISSSVNIMTFLEKNKSVIDKNTTLNNWFRNDEVRIDGTDGAGQVRQIGRYLLIRNAAALVEKMKSLISSAKKDLAEPKVYIHIFSGISGGTGAGTFLDVCYLAREAIGQLGISADLLGYFFLPDVNIAKGLSPQVAANVQENGYASLTELDYCMNFGRNGGSWIQEYPGIGIINMAVQPVDLCHLISAKDNVGNDISDGYNYAMNVVTEYFMDFVVKAEEQHTLNSHITNFGEIKKQVEKNSGATYEYSVIGAATATIPFKQVLTYLASGMFDKMKNLIDTLPSENNVDQFVKQNQLQFDDIKKKLSNKCSFSFAAPDLRWQDVKGNTKILIDNLEGQYAQYKNVLYTNLSALSRDLDSYVVNNSTEDGVESLISFINEKLQNLAADPEYGPFFAAALLQTTGKDLLAKVSGLKTQATERYDHAIYNQNRDGGYYQLYQKADDDFNLNSNLVTGSSKYRAYVGATINFYKSKAEVELYECMIKLLKKLDEQLHDLSAKFMSPFRDVVNDLYDTFKENSKYIEGIIDGSITVHSYEMPIATISDMKPQMDQTLADMDVKQKFSELIKSLLSKEGIDACTSGDENTVCVVVNRYFTTLFHDYSEMTITKYLEQKFQVTNPVQLIDKITTEIMDKLYTKANPMYWVSSTYDIDTASPLGYVTYPQTSSEIKEASERLSDVKGSGNIKPRSSKVVDRVSIMRCLVGVPVFGYQGVSQYERKSVESIRIGKHLYEGKTYIDRNGNTQKGEDWRYLPSPTPLTLMNSDNSSILREMADKAADLYRKAVELDAIYSPDPNSYFFRTVTSSYMDKIKAIRDRSITKSPAERIAAANEIENLKQSKEYNLDQLSINNDSTPLLGAAQKEDVRIDHFVKSPKIQAKVREEVERLESIDKIIDELEPKVDADMSTLLLAILTGVIKYDPAAKSVVYEYGFNNKEILSDPSMGSIAQVAPIFQSFINFKKLDSALKADIKETAEKQNNVNPMLQIIKDNHAIFSARMEKINIILEFANSDPVFAAKMTDFKEFINYTNDLINQVARRIKLDEI